VRGVACGRLLGARRGAAAEGERGIGGRV
jgi:hypothetical protein